MRQQLDRVARIWAVTAAVGWLFLLALVIGAGTGHAASSDTDDRTPQLEQRRDAPQTTQRHIEPRVMCPSCDTTLNHSDSPAAVDMREWITAAINAGWTEQEIYDGLVAEYGGDESVLATPRAHGAGLLVWIIPVVIVIGALLAGVGSLRSWRRQTRSGSSSADHSASRSPSTSSSEPSSPI